MGIISKEIRYDKIDIESVIREELLSDPTVTAELPVVADASIDGDIRLRGTPSAGQALTAQVFTVYKKNTGGKQRNLIVFNAVKDNKNEDSFALKGISPLDGALKIFKQKNINDDELELIIPISLCNLGVAHWNFLHIVKKGNRYTAKLYEPKSCISRLAAYPIGYIRDSVKTAFSNCAIEVVYLDQQADANDTICGICTTENISSVINNKPFVTNIEAQEDNLRLTHFARFAKLHPHTLDHEQIIFPPIKVKEKDNEFIKISNPDPLSKTSSSNGQTSDSSNRDEIEDAEDLSLPSVKTDKLPTESINAEMPVSTDPQHNHNLTSAKDYLILIQQAIFKIDDWQTGLGGNDVYFYRRDEKSPNREILFKDISAPDGVKLILKEIREACNTIKYYLFMSEVNKEKIYETAFIKIQEIARKRLYKPRFSLWFFQVRSETTTDFYAWVAQLDPKGKVKPSLDQSKVAIAQPPELLQEHKSS